MVGSAAALFCLPTLSFAGADDEVALTIDSAIERTLKSNSLVKASQIDEERAAVQLKRARAERFLPEAEIDVEGGLVPEARGSAIESPDDSDSLSGLGPFYKLGITVIQPLYTFGRLKNLERAALGGVAAASAKTALMRSEMEMLAIKAYWSLDSAARALDVAAELKENYLKLIEEVESRLEDEDSDIDDSTLMEVKSSAFKVDKIHREAQEDFRRSREGMRILIHEEGERSLKTVSAGAPPLEISAAEFESRLDGQIEAHGQIALFDAASKALAAKVDLMASDRMPLFFVAAGAGLARAGNRDDQDNPFVVDDYNYTRVGAQVGIKWSANVYKKNLAVEEVEKEYVSLLEKRVAFKDRLAYDAVNAFNDALTKKDLFKSAENSLRASKSWLRLEIDNWEMGLGEATRLLDAYEAYYEMKGVEIRMKLDYNLALATMAGKLDIIDLYVRWLNDGKVRF